ncbi:MAG: polysaccharide biosynthesis tyrosine autokinase [Acidimicrobiia bacterium]|nr:polysaccharide biosynthesis tyrosine autokinase [Acidimicrobiia bacterium]
MTADEAPEGVDLWRVWSVVRWLAPLIVGFALLAAGAAYYLAASSTDLYKASARVRVIDPNSDAVFNGVQIRVDPKRDVETQIQLLSSVAVEDKVNEQLGEDVDQVSSVTFSGVGQTDLIQITVVSPSPEVAAEAANTYAAVYVTQRKEQLRSSFVARSEELLVKVRELETQIKDVDARLANNRLPALEADTLRAQRAALVAQQTDLRSLSTQFEVEAASRSGNVEVANEAVVPTEPFEPTPVRDAALAGILALIFAAGVALLIDRLDNKIHSPEDIEEMAVDVPVIGTIPTNRDAHKRHRRELVALDSVDAEAYRALRTNIRFSAIGQKRTRILVTSAIPGEGKTTVVGNLAVVLAQSGLKVVIVSADLRKPQLEEIFGLSMPAEGLTGVLLGDTALVDVLLPIPLPSVDRAYLVPSGQSPQNPAELLGSERMSTVLDRIESAGADFILLDTPPVLPVADALAMAQMVDGVIVLAKVGSTTKPQLTEVLDRLAQVNAPIIGIVLNEVSESRRYGPYRGRYGRYGRYGYGRYSRYTKYEKYAKDSKSSKG